MITDEIKRQVLEGLLEEMEVREVDGMGKDPDATATGSDDPCPYCGESCSMENPKCSMHSMGAKPGAQKPKPAMKIKLGGGKPKEESVY